MNDAEIQTEAHPRLIVEDVDRAIACYQAAFGAKLNERYLGPNGVVVHAAIQIGRSTLSMAQEVVDWKLLAPRSVGGSPVLLHLTLSDPDAASERLCQEGGVVIIPIEDRPYGKREGRVRDPFGHLWILSRPIEALHPEEIQRRLAPPRTRAREET